MLKKRIIMLGVVAGLIISSAACTSNQTNQVEDNNANDVVSTTAPKKEKVEKNINAVAEKLGLTDGSETFYTMIGATDGKEYNGGSVELYQFDEKSDSYKQIINDGVPFKAAAYKDGIILVFPAGTEADTDLVEQFNGIEFK